MKKMLLSIYFDPRQRQSVENTKSAPKTLKEQTIENDAKSKHIEAQIAKLQNENNKVIESSASENNSGWLNEDYNKALESNAILDQMSLERRMLMESYEWQKWEIISDTTEQLDNLKSTIGVAETIERTEADKKFGDMIYKLNRWNEKFDQIMVDISSGNYEQAFANMDNFKDVKLFVTDGEGNFDTKKMQELLTYSYGSMEVKNMTWTVSESLYNKSRTEKVLTAESDVMKNFSGVDISPNEDAFNKWEHIPTNASNLFPEQTISTSVVATPKGGTHRLDHFNYSVDISSQTADINSPELKQSLLNAYEWQIDNELQKINSTLWTEISKEDYKSMILWEKTPDSVVPWLAFKAEPKFFEGRAMLKHNVCNNLTYWLAFPTFNLEEIKKPQPSFDIWENRGNDGGNDHNYGGNDGGNTNTETDSVSTNPESGNTQESVDNSPTESTTDNPSTESNNNSSTESSTDSSSTESNNDSPGWTEASDNWSSQESSDSGGKESSGDGWNAESSAGNNEGATEGAGTE